MTVSNTTARIEYVADGAQTAFPFPWRQLAPTDIVAYEGDTQRVDFTLSGGATDSGGTLTFATPPFAGERVVLIRATPRTQPVDLHEYDVLSAETQEREYDRLTLLIQEIQAQLDRALQFAPTDDLAGISVRFPLPGHNEFIKWNALGTALETAVGTGTGGGGDLGGEGAAGQVAFWVSPSNLAGDSAMTWDSTANTLLVGSLPQGPLTPGPVRIGLAGPSNATGMQALLVQTHQGDPGLIGLVTLGDDRVGVSSWNFRGTGASNPIYGANFGVVFNTNGVANGCEIDVQNDSATNYQGQALWLNGSTRSTSSAGHRANAILIDTQDGSKWERGILFKEGYVANGATGSIEKMGIHFEQSQDADFIVMQPRVGAGGNVAMKVTDPAFTVNRFELLNSGIVRSSSFMSSAAFPAFSFSDSIANGMYLEGVNTLGFASAGLRRVTIGAALNVYPVAPTANNTGTLNLWDQFSAHSVGLMAADFIGVNFRIRLPATPGTAGQQLITSGVDGNGIETWSYASPTSGGPGSGTVTNTGVLAANAVILGDGGTVVKALVGLGTTTQVLHGNAGGAPTWAQVAIADIAASGTPSATTFLRGDGQWGTVAGAGTVTTTGTITAGGVPFWTAATVLGMDGKFIWDNVNKKLVVGLVNDATSTSKVATFSGNSLGNADPVVQVQARFAGASPTVNFPVAATFVADFTGGTQMPIGFGSMIQLGTHDYAGAGTSIPNASIWTRTTSITPQSADLTLGSLQAGVLVGWLNLSHSQALFGRDVRTQVSGAVSATGGNLIASRDYLSTAFAVNEQVGNVRFTAENVNPLINSELATISGTVDGLGGTRVKGRLTLHTSDGAGLVERMRINADGLVTVGLGGTLATAPGNVLTVAAIASAPAAVARIESLAGSAMAARTVLSLVRTRTGGAMADGFGPMLDFVVRDSVENIDNTLGRLLVERVTINGTGNLRLQTAIAGVLGDRLLVTGLGHMFYVPPPTPATGLFGFTATGTVKTAVFWYTDNNATGVGFIAPPTSAGGILWQLPGTLGAPGSVLTNNGGGVLTWGAAGSLVTGTPGSVFFAGADGAVTQDNAGLFWDNTSNLLRVGAGPFTGAISSLYVSGSAQTGRFERTDTAVNNVPTVLELVHSTSGDMIDGFGLRQVFTIRDGTAESTLARILVQRAGSDGSSVFSIQTAVGGVLGDRLIINNQGVVSAVGLVSVAAGIGASEKLAVWTGPTTMTSSDNLKWSDANTRLTVTGESGATGTLGSSVPQKFAAYINTSNYTTNDIAGLVINVRQDSSVGDLRVKPGIIIDAYHGPDNGGEVSGLFVTQRGGGNAASFFKLTDAPDGKPSFPSNGWAIECQTTAALAAAMFAAGPFGSPYAANCQVNYLGNSGAKGVLVSPGDGVTFDTREAFAVGNLGNNGANSAQQFQVLLNGNLFSAGGILVGTAGGGNQGPGTINTRFALYVNGTEVVNSRKTGWGAASGTKARTTFATDSATAAQVGARLGALIDDLMAHGLINV